MHQSAALFWSDESIRKMDCHALVVSAWHQLNDVETSNIGSKPPSKTTVINRINKSESRDTYAYRYGRHEADRHFVASGESMPVHRPFELVYIDGTEFRQVCLFSSDVPVPSSKMKTVEVMDAFSLFVFPSIPFAGPYRSEMGMAAILGALMAPTLDEHTLAQNPMAQLLFGRIGRLRGDNDKAIIPPSAIGNLTNVIRRVELAKKYAPDEKSNLENYFGFKKARLDGLPGTVLSARSRRRSIRRDPLAEASLTRDSFARKNEELRLEWNAMGHSALGGRSPNDVMLEYIMHEGKIRFTPPGEIKRHLARAVQGILTTDGVTFDGILYRWNRDGITQVLSNNLSSQAFRQRLEGTAKCDVHIRVYDWNLDSIEVLDEHANQFVPLWSDDPDYTAFLSRAEHKFHQRCASSGATGAQTSEEKARHRGDNLKRAWRDMHTQPFRFAKTVSSILEMAEIRSKARNIQDDPDLTNFDDLLLETAVAGAERVDVPLGPSQKRETKGRPEPSSRAKSKLPESPFDWGGLEPAPRTNQLMLEQLEEEDLDGGIDWDADDDQLGLRD
ncbi:hypothetical protein [Sphingomonas sp. 3P27F8]|uniref:hypothetical protein n=1 Tax=Sphingomonas sp. 3P27F8 TaxID=2502213 RepID=UPI0010F4B48E|nr:hypothetical protein [Sphingomonas sp. 3P27F8]